MSAGKCVKSVSPLSPPRLPQSSLFYLAFIERGQVNAKGQPVFDTRNVECPNAGDSGERIYPVLWCTFPSVSGHRPISIPTDRLFQPPSGPWSDWNNSCGGLVSHCFYDVADRPSIVSPPNSSLRSAQKTEVLTTASEPVGHDVWAEVSSPVWCTVKGILLCRLYGCTESKIRDQKPLYSGCSRTSSQWCELQRFNDGVLFSVSLASYRFYIIRTPCLAKFWSPGHFVLASAKKKRKKKSATLLVVYEALQRSGFALFSTAVYEGVISMQNSRWRTICASLTH